MLRVCCAIFAIVLLIPNIVVFAKPLDEASVLIEAEKLYQSGKFSEAANRLETIAATGTGDPDLLYNLGNAYFKSKQLGLAMAAYVGALSIDPHDADLRANIRFAEKSLQDKLTAFRNPDLTEYLFFWSRWFSDWTSLYLISVFVSVALLSLSAQWIMKTTKTWLRVLKWTSAAAAVIGLSGMSFNSMRHLPMGAVTSDVAEIYSAPTKEAGQKIFELKAGAPFWIHSVSVNWYKISISDGKQGWINEDSIRSYQ